MSADFGVKAKTSCNLTRVLSFINVIRRAAVCSARKASMPETHPQTETIFHPPRVKQSTTRCRTSPRVVQQQATADEQELSQTMVAARSPFMQPYIDAAILVTLTRTGSSDKLAQTNRGLHRHNHGDGTWGNWKTITSIYC